MAHLPSRLMAAPRAVIVGAGYAGARLAKVLADRGPLVVTTSSPDRLALLREAGFDARRWNLDEATSPPLDSDDVAGAVVHCHVPPPPRGGDDPRLDRMLRELPAVPRRIVYLSSTGVYGDARGATVDEDTSPAPHAPRTVRRLAAEALLRAWCTAHGSEWTVLRVPGIYGPGRLPRERLLRGDPVIVEAEAGPGNRIHVDDLVAACMQAGLHPAAANRIFNLGDGDESSSTRYLTRVAELLGLPAPPQLPRAAVQQAVSIEAWSFLGPSRRVDTRRIRRELGFRPRYASLDDGLRACIAEEASAGAP